ncbi:MAG: hypothetical protein ABFC42_09270 [Sulfuricella sp.]
MALLDVSDILTDPDFMDTALVCERNAQTVGNNGMATNAVTLTTFAGVVTSDNGDLLDRTAGGDRIKGNMTIHTRFPLDDGSSINGADIVQWNGRRYTVTVVNDWSHFGRGFVCATCDLIPLAG